MQFLKVKMVLLELFCVRGCKLSPFFYFVSSCNKLIFPLLSIIVFFNSELMVELCFVVHSILLFAKLSHYSHAFFII